MTPVWLWLLLFKIIHATQQILASNEEIFENVITSPRDPSSPPAWDFDLSFTGVSTFAHLPYSKCLIHPDESFDIAILGCPFDSAVSYRPGGPKRSSTLTLGARFGPRAIRTASERQSPNRAFGTRLGLNPYKNWAKMVDCGDIPVSQLSQIFQSSAYRSDNTLALKQIQTAFETLLSRKIHTRSTSRPETRTGRIHPRILTLGGDHSIALPILRALGKIYGPLSVVHFDSHLDTWAGKSNNSIWTSTQSQLTHGTMLSIAGEEGLIANGTSIHAGLRTRLWGSSFGDYEEDEKIGFVYIEADDIDILGTQGVIDMILETVGTSNPVYLSVDIDVLDPGVCPGTGTPESGGWTVRELRQIIRGLQSLRVVGGDIVEVSPPYDNQGQTTALAAADILFDMISIMIMNPGFEGPVVDITPPSRASRIIQRGIAK